MTRTHGFTRTETAVVLGGAAILAATFFPLAVRAQNAAQLPDPKATCQSNLKQVGLGILQYTQDYDEKYPMAYYNQGRQRVSWRGAIQPYIKSTAIMACPSNPNNRQKTRTDREIEIPVSYAVNGVLSWSFDSMNMAQIQSPATLISIGESVRDDPMMPMPLSVNEFARGNALFAGHFSLDSYLRWRQAEATARPADDAQNDENSTDDENSAPLGALTNCAFADGHVKAMRPTETLPHWYNAPVNARTADDLARRLYAAQLFYTAWLQDAANATIEDAAPPKTAPSKKQAPDEKKPDEKPEK